MGGGALTDFGSSGRLWLRNALNEPELSILEQAATSNGPGARVTHTPAINAILGADGPVVAALTPYLPNAFPTRIVSFDKNADSNWGVPWHQDKVIAVAAKEDCEGFTNWSRKGEVWHCQPPEEILAKMLFLRIHLDDEAVETVPMQIALGSHTVGLRPKAEATSYANRFPIETCIGRRGDVLVLNMLTLHRSDTADKATTRRVLRVDYTNAPLPLPMRWHAHICSSRPW